jgi:hypothetical protein
VREIGEETREAGLTTTKEEKKKKKKKRLQIAISLPPGGGLSILARASFQHSSHGQ